MGMKRLALVLALAHGTAGCAHQQLTNRQVAAGAVTAAAVITLTLLLSVQCNELTMQCHR
jgi:methionine-rich copper-binding protein CopC